MNWTARLALASWFVCIVCLGGCQSPYHADQGALAGGLGGAGIGALIGSATGNAGPGAAIGAGVGALSGAAIGAGMDEVEARNRAMIEQQLGRQVAPGAVSINEVLAMVRSGVAEELIVTHIRTHGMAAPLQSGDLIALQQQGVSVNVIRAMQESPPRPVVVQQPVPAPVIVEEYPYGPYWGPPVYYHPHYWPHHHPGVSWGVGFSN